MAPRAITQGQRIAIGGFAIGSAGLALGISAGFTPNFGSVVGYLAIPFVIALLAWTVVGILRLILVGFLPGDSYRVFTENAGPWTQAWLVVRFGLMLGWFILIAAIVIAVLARTGLANCVYALAYLVFLRMFIDLVAGTVFNAELIKSRAGTE
jgi:hypothetical protein